MNYNPHQKIKNKLVSLRDSVSYTAWLLYSTELVLGLGLRALEDSVVFGVLEPNTDQED